MRKKDFNIGLGGLDFGKNLYWALLVAIMRKHRRLLRMKS